jgi:pimeloyl-ACP methyl ester carboxylesterase
MSRQTSVSTQGLHDDDHDPRAGIAQREVRIGKETFPFLEAGEGPLVLCLHGFPDTPWTFRHQLRALSRAGYHVVAPYMRGYASGCIAGPYQPAKWGEDALAISRALGHDQVVMFGHDWGCTAAYAAALAEPRTVRRLVTAAVPYGLAMTTALMTNAKQQRRSWYMFFFQTILAEAAVGMNDYALIETLWRDWSPGYADPSWDLARIRETLSVPGVLEAALGYYRTAFNPSSKSAALDPLESKLGVEPITTPSLYLHGAEDGCIGLEVTEGMEALFPSGLRRVVLEGVGHFLQVEAPDRVTAEILDFLR